MDIPYELWNETSAEVSDLKKQVCVKRRYVCNRSKLVHKHIKISSTGYKTMQIKVKSFITSNNSFTSNVIFTSNNSLDEM